MFWPLVLLCLSRFKIEPRSITLSFRYRKRISRDNSSSDANSSKKREFGKIWCVLRPVSGFSQPGTGKRTLSELGRPQTWVHRAAFDGQTCVSYRSGGFSLLAAWFFSFRRIRSGRCFFGCCGCLLAFLPLASRFRNLHGGFFSKRATNQSQDCR